MDIELLIMVTVITSKGLGKLCYKKTSLLRRLQAQTLPDDAPPIGKIHPFAVTFEPLMGF